MPQKPQTAKGIPDRGDYGDLSRLQPGQLLAYVRQKHDALRAGPHEDLRLGGPEVGGLFSWAVRKGLPAPGQKHWAVQQPLHDPAYADFQGTIPKEQYGGGKVRTADKGSVLLAKAAPGALSLSTAHTGDPSRYKLVQVGDDPRKWLLINSTPQEPIPYHKLHYRSHPAEDIDKVLAAMQPGASAQAKIDGAAVLARLGPTPTRNLEIASYRTGASGRPILHTERVLGHRPELSNLPRHLLGSVLRGEVYGTREGKSIPPAELGGLLNAGLAKSLAAQKERGIDLKTMLFNLQQYGKKPVGPEVPYEERRKMLEEILPYLPAGKFHLPEEAKTPSDARKLWEKIVSGEHPLTHEGIVVHPPIGVPEKIKRREEQDVNVVGFFPATTGSKYDRKAVGGFEYSWEPGGPPVGRVGTGLSDELRRDMFEHPEKYIGRIARVIAQEKLPSGALRAPAFLALHEG